jgi:CubicO group peptidase (beta-lactamase class C family)
MATNAPSTDDPIAKAIAEIVDAGGIAGASTLTWRKDKVVQNACVGWRDIEGKLPIERGTLFRIASMTKPITSVATLMLMEEGKLSLSDPITRWVPEFTNVRVMRSPLGSLEDTIAAERAITIDDLLTHRSGLTYGAFHLSGIAKAHDDALGGALDSHHTPDEWIARLASLPLIDQPGANFHYGCSTDLLGFVIARIENAPLSEVLSKRLFAPLGMRDTSFAVAPKDKMRCAQMYGIDHAGKLSKQLPVGTLPDRPSNLKYESGGQGLWSTLDDYLAFARVFIGGGSVDGKQLLRTASLALMMSNHLTAVQRANAKMLGMRTFAIGHGFGYGVAVVTEPEYANPLVCRGGKGTVGWGGAYGGWWQADPTDQSILIFLAHNNFNPLHFAVYEAIAKYHALATA